MSSNNFVDCVARDANSGFWLGPDPEKLVARIEVLEDVLRRLVDLAEDFRGRGIYAEGEALIDEARAALGSDEEKT